MSRQLTSKEIDGKTYEFSQFNTTHALRHFSTLTQIIGEPLAIALGAIFQGKKPKDLKDVLSREIPPDTIPKVVTSLLGNLEGSGTDSALNLVKTLTSGDFVLCDHAKVNFDTHYAGPTGLAHLSKVVIAALEAQYGNFLGAVSARVAATAPAAPMGAPIVAR